MLKGLKGRSGQLVDLGSGDGRIVSLEEGKDEAKRGIGRMYSILGD